MACVSFFNFEEGKEDENDGGIVETRDIRGIAIWGGRDDKNIENETLNVGGILEKCWWKFNGWLDIST